jgi:glycogen operon protein
LKIPDKAAHRIPVGAIETLRGTPHPFGADVKRSGINFAVFSKNASEVSLVFFDTDEGPPVLEIPLRQCENKTGDVWHVFVQGVNPGVRYGWRIGGEQNHIHRFNKDAVLIDPYSIALSGGGRWGPVDCPENVAGGVVKHDSREDAKNVKDDQALFAAFAPSRETRDAGGGIPGCFKIRRSMAVEDTFDWGHDRQLKIPLSESIIYEMHVRGFTRHVSSGIKHPGTYAGVIEKIPYLRELGVTAVELLPVNEFEEADSDRINPVTGRRLLNYWGYQTINFFTPKASYAAAGSDGENVLEFKKMVKALHEAGIEVILDVVFNHTAEGNEMGPSLSFRGIDNSIYYIIDPVTGNYHNYSGCGNTFNCNHPVVRGLIVDCLRYWVMEMHVDGFRFDLASILGRGRDGSVLSNPPLLERIAADPVLADTKLIAEAWDAAGLYQVGTFPNWGRWAEWNGRFRDDIRRFVRGEDDVAGDLARRLSGSPDLYQGGGRAPYHSINFVTCHDGFTLRDLVSYNEKHNEENGEDNRDGTNDNRSWNCGVEGPTDFWDVNTLRLRQMKNVTALLFVSQGVPMMLAGDEFGKTQRGNNNAYCQDNEISWLDWDLKKTYPDLFRFFRLMIKFRKKHAAFKRESFQEDTQEHNMSWHGVEVGRPDWSSHSRAVALLINGSNDAADIYIMANSFWEELRFQLPEAMHGRKWFRFVDTMLGSPHDISELNDESYIYNQSAYTAGPRSVVILVGK